MRTFNHEHFRIKIPKKTMERPRRKQKPKILHRVQSRQVLSPQRLEMLQDQESVFVSSSDSDSGRQLFKDMCRHLFTTPILEDCEEICERCYDRCKGLCLLEQHSDEHEQNLNYLSGAHALRINSCSRLNKSFENNIPEKNEFRPREKVTNIVDAIKGLSKSFIAVDTQHINPKKEAKSIIIDDDSDINFLTPLTIDKLFLDRFLKTPACQGASEK